MKPVKHFCWMLSSPFPWPCHTYLALGGVRIRLTGNGIMKLWFVDFFQLLLAKSYSKGGKLDKR
jgi:hypothetical protein